MPRCEGRVLGRIADVRGNLSAHVNRDGAQTSIKPSESFIIMACLFIGPAYLQCLHRGALHCKLGLHAIYYAKTEYESLSISETFARGEKWMKTSVFPYDCDGIQPRTYRAMSDYREQRRPIGVAPQTHAALPSSVMIESSEGLSLSQAQLRSQAGWSSGSGLRCVC